MTDRLIHDRLHLNGEWVETEQRLEVTDPATGEVIARVSCAGEEHWEAALDAAATAAPVIAGTPARERSEMLRRAFEIMSERTEDLARLITRENGKVLADARSEITYAAEFFRWFAEEAVRVRGDFRAAPSGDKTIIVDHQPVGVSVLVTPWNFPSAMVTRKLAPAIAAGCPVVLKPASQTPLSALAVVDILTEAGVPPGVVNVVTADPPGPVVSHLLSDPRVRNLSFTGSTAVGRELLRQAADRVVRTSMELGGNAPFVVLDDADLDRTVAAAMVAKMRNGGAACTAANRFIVQQRIAEPFTEAMRVAMEDLRVGPGLDDDTTLGASVSLSERDKIADLVSGAVERGAEVLTGARVPEGPGAFYAPTVLQVDAEDPLLDSEIFGPVAPITTVADDAEAIALANRGEAGLISYVCGGDVGRALGVARQLDAGMVAVNRGVISDPAAPFGGTKQSGLGREGGFEGIHEFLESRYIGVDL